MKTIGELIKAKVTERGISTAEFANKLGYERNNGYNIYKMNNIDSII